MTDPSAKSRQELMQQFQDALQRMDEVDGRNSDFLGRVRGLRAKGGDISQACREFRENAESLHALAHMIGELGRNPNIAQDPSVLDGVFRAGVILATEIIDNGDAESMCAPPPASNAPAAIKGPR